ncbi:mercuric reductase [Chitinophaga agrisoli]|uniref:Mercuric reductase n=1 Tax=Chitinophaga agrisoli TaxID=2607653 RepID=A0A5B2VI23_9BACT|nr:mercuric reductase [Chitinophaga agrisoli]KAA2238555.1 mercuric reductase [Chitinophaga agrisoli]
MQQYKAIIVGSGQGGNPLAWKLAAAGWSTAVVEKRFIGGTCINDGCTPTKTMIASAQVAHMVANSKQWGVTVNGWSVDLERVVARKDKIVLDYRSGIEKSLEKTENITVYHGEAVFSGPKTLTVKLNEGATEELSAEYIFLDIGTLPMIPPVPGLDEVSWLTSTTILDLTTLPSHLLILGGSYIALELGQLYRRLGAEVTIMERGPRLLNNEDDDVAEAVQKIMQDEGIHIFTGTQLKQVSQTSRGIVCSIQKDGQTHSVEGSHLLIATGRVPQTATLQPDKAGIELDEKGFIRVNDHLETTVPGIYAMGDAKGGPAFTHIAWHDHLIVYKHLTGASASVKDRQVPYCMFIDPQLGRIGLSEKEATARGLDYTVARLDMTRVARALETGTAKGFMKALVANDTGKILGAMVLGPEGGELMSLLQMAMAGGITAQQMKEMVFAHPLYAESLNNLFYKL